MDDDAVAADLCDGPTRNWRRRTGLQRRKGKQRLKSSAMQLVACRQVATVVALYTEPSSLHFDRKYTSRHWSQFQSAMALIIIVLLPKVIHFFNLSPSSSLLRKLG
mmetsp:Transcript_4000/g.12003  ORF Transcript_4000/g.12003 Transcript_4000/m.12003 type:complete len:106 (-) Transcript_4000:1950-2267(-)